MSFVDVFGFRGEGDDEPDEGWTQPRWLGPPQDELGVAVPQAVVIGRSARGVVALSHVVAYSTGASFEFAAEGRGLRQSQANRLFHEQHATDPDELPDGMIRLGLELADGARVSNLGGWRAQRRLMGENADPEEPVFVPHGGGGGTGGRGRVSMRPGYWLWPLPPPGPLRISCEWPALDVPLSTAEIDASAIVAAAKRTVPLWAGGGG